MQEQGVITAYYPCPDPEELEDIHHTILACHGFLPKYRLLGILKEDVQIGQTGVAVFISVWAAVMLQVFKRHTARIKQIWGVTSDEEPIVQLNPDWDYEIKRSNCGLFVNLCTVLYILLYVGAIFGVLAWQFELDDTDVLYSYSSLILVAVIKGGNLLWAKLAPCLVSLENLRTERAYSET
eukprot:Skav215170  [mRNA]  locus=scaffold4227:78535:79335:+ [translate_table: standard]